jgi:hypothetical protein
MPNIKTDVYRKTTEQESALFDKILVGRKITDLPLYEDVKSYTLTRLDENIEDDIFHSIYLCLTGV